MLLPQLALKLVVAAIGLSFNKKKKRLMLQVRFAVIITLVIHLYILLAMQCFYVMRNYHFPEIGTLTLSVTLLNYNTQHCVLSI